VSPLHRLAAKVWVGSFGDGWRSERVLDQRLVSHRTAESSVEAVRTGAIAVPPLIAAVGFGKIVG